MNVSSKVLLVSFLIPIVALSSIIFLLYSFNRGSWVQGVLSIFTVASVFVLVWERLHELATKRLEYLYENTLSKLYELCHIEKKSLKEGLYKFIYQKQIFEYLNKLKRFGSFLYFIKLYPARLLHIFEEIQEISDKYSKKINELQEFSKKANIEHFNERLFAYLLGLTELKSVGFSKEYISENKKLLKKLKEEKPELIEELCKFWRLLINNLEKTLTEMENFMEENSLTIPKVNGKIAIC